MGASCTVKVQFAPTTGGSLTGSLAVAYTSATVTGSPVSLTGTGVTPTFTANVSSSSLAFGNVTTGTSTTLDLTVTNTGTGALAGGTFTFGGGTPQPFSQVTTGTFPPTAPSCGAALAFGASCTIRVRFAPTTATTFTRSLTVAYTSATVTGSPVTLTGTGIAAVAVLAVSTNSINFGTVAVGSTSAPGPITISNTGNATLNGLSIADPDPTDFPGTGSTCGTTLAAGSSCTITGVFTPQAVGPVSTTLTISSTNGGTQLVTLSGTGN